MIIPCTLFGLCAALSGPKVELPSFAVLEILARTPHIVCWLWIMVLQFCLHNQRHPNSLEEDKLNKPWRPLPSGLIDLVGTNRLLALTYVVAIVLAIHFGCVTLFLAWTALTIIYNDFGASDAHGIIKNGLNAGGYFCLFASAIQVTVGSKVWLSKDAWIWVGFLISVMFTTIHSQDFRDEVGDSARGRKTLLSGLGNTPVRLALIVGVSAWSVAIPYWFDALNWQTMVAPGAMASGVIGLTLAGIGKSDTWLDSVMYRMWCVWMISLCPTPLVASMVGA